MFALSSCGDDVYSCDPKVDLFVKENLSELTSLSRANLLSKYDLETQKSIFRAATPQKRYDLWKDKFETVLSQKRWSEEEIKHIRAVANYMRVDFYVKSNMAESKKLNNNINSYMNKWINEARNDFKWTDETIRSMAFSLYDNEAQFQSQLESDKLKRLNTTASATTVEENCSCNPDNGVAVYDCGTSCKTGDCKTSDYGCGYFYVQTCNGTCQPI